MKNVNTLLTILRSGYVKRHHTHQNFPQQDLAQHSWRVAQLVWYVSRESSFLVMCAMVHDVPELFTGDIPAPTKWALPELEDLLREQEEEHREGLGIHQYIPGERWKCVVKFCDYLELVLFCLEERDRGSRAVDAILDRALMAAKRNLEGMNIDARERAEELLDYVEQKTRSQPTPGSGNSLPKPDSTLGLRVVEQFGIPGGSDHEIHNTAPEEERLGGSVEGAPLSRQTD